MFPRIFTWASLLLLTAGLSFAVDPDFSGTWTLDESRSTVRTLPVNPDRRLFIDHRLGVVECHADRETPKAVVCRARTDGKESAHRSGEFDRKSVAKWEGDALLINTIASSRAGTFTEMDRWKLSRDGHTLRIRRQVVSLHGEVEAVLIYEKQ